MKKITDMEFAEFLTNYPLYSELKAVSSFKDGENTFSNPNDFSNKPFKFVCPNEKNEQTFRTEIAYSNGTYFGFGNLLSIQAESLPVYFDEKTGSLDIRFHIVGKCQSCDTKIDFLIHARSTDCWDNRHNGIDIIIQKIGQFPPFEIKPDKVVDKYLTKEDSSNYRKALINLSVSYGIGAYAYFRRIIENEIKRIIKDISELEFDGSNEVKAAVSQYDKKHQMSNLIEVVNSFLPSSLRELGDNPIKLLYDQLSKGLHTYSDQECLEKAKKIDVLLTFVIRKVNEEKYQFNEVRDAMKTLREK